MTTLTADEIKMEMLARGFEIQHTGGNCYAYHIYMDDDKKWELLITQDCHLPIDDGTADNDIIAGLYDSSGVCVSDCIGTLSAALHFYEYIASEVIGETE